MITRTSILILILSCLLSAQNQQDYAIFEFSKPNISYVWLAKIKYDKRSDDNFGLRFYDEFYTTLIIPNRVNPQWRDENRFRSFVYDQQKDIKYGLYATSWLLRDTKGGEVIQYATSAMGLRSEYRVSEYLLINPYAGYQNAQNINRTEWGWDLGISGKLDGINLGNYRTEIELNSEYDFFGKRQNSTNVFDVRLATDFSASARDTMSVSYGYDKQQFFAADTSLLVYYTRQNKSLQNTLDYAVSKKSFLRYHTFLGNRQIQDDTPDDINKRDVVTLENRVIYRHLTGSLKLEIGLDTFLETENNIGSKRDSEERQTGLRSSITYLPVNSDKFDLELSYIKFQYDTPDSNNDDRDELRFIGLLRHEHRFSPFLESRLELYTYLYHRIYLRKEQSANNNWNRRFWFDATVSYKKNNLQNTFHSRVLAIYTVYDYDNLFSETKSFVFRKYLAADSILIPVYEDFYCGLFGRIELEDRGSFIENIFSQRIIESAQTLYFDIFLRKKLLYRFRWEFGYKVSSYVGWRHIPTKIRVREKDKYTHYMRIIYPLNPRLRITGQMAFTFENDRGREKLNYTTGNIFFHYNF